MNMLETNEKKKNNSVIKQKVSSMKYKNNVKNNVEISDLKNANNQNLKVQSDKQGPTVQHRLIDTHYYI